MRWAASCIAFSGFFLRREAWSAVEARFERFVCVDAMRDDPELGFAAYLEAAQRALLELPPPYLLLGHSFGAVPARLLAQRLAPERIRLALISGLAVADGQSAAEAYQATAQRSMSDFCRLDAAQGRVALVDQEAFAVRLHAPDPVPGHSRLAGYEPLSLLVESLPLLPLACPQHYVLCLDDQIADASSQAASAELAGARRLERRGGHMGPLREVGWLDEVCRGWPQCLPGFF
ncbi:alpha/beta fold hydrolase [Chromobacterium phragmitis]|uniref:Alpha/beta fold hydrolase n=1 Tax=Chromobacterium phragmitis TaxID=2202141 RepID=A0ABV0IZF8_9NEIS